MKTGAWCFQSARITSAWPSRSPVLGRKHNRRGFCRRCVTAPTWASVPCLSRGADFDPRSITATAVKDGDGYHLNGTKTFNSNGTVADLALVFAVSDSDGDANQQARLSAFVVDTQSDGCTVSERLDTTDNRTMTVGEIEMQDVHVPAENLLSGKEGGGVAIFNHAMLWERVGLFAAHVGAMERILKKTVQATRRRKQSGHDMARLQGISHKMADMKVRLEASKMLIYKAATQLDRSTMTSMESPASTASFDASIAKLFTSEAFVQSAMEAMHILGSVSYLVGDYSIERDLRDAFGSTLYSGTSEAQRTIIATWLGL